MPSRAVVGGQHTLDAEYFRRIEAMNFTLAHDDSQRSEELTKAEIVLIGASRTSKTPTSIYLANRGYKTANVSLVPNIPPPPDLNGLKGPYVVGLIASPERISEIRRNRMLSLNSSTFDSYIDMDLIKEEMAFTKKLCAQNQWQVLDVTRKSIEETAATVISLYEERRRQQHHPLDCHARNGYVGAYASRLSRGYPRVGERHARVHSWERGYSLPPAAIDRRRGRSAQAVFQRHPSGRGRDAPGQA